MADVVGVAADIIWTSNHPEWNAKRRVFLLKYGKNFTEYALNSRAEYMNNTLKLVQAYKKSHYRSLRLTSTPHHKKAMKIQTIGAEDRKVKNYTRRHAAQSTSTKSAPTAIACQASPKTSKIPNTYIIRKDHLR
ncbi:hypothetical protein T11_12663, partial [Trichinella zimbabwensis]